VEFKFQIFLARLSLRRRLYAQYIVKQKYWQAALRAGHGRFMLRRRPSPEGCNPITSNLYEMSQTIGLPEAAVRASLGCGNPTALAI